ncbi:GGDEF domain-containing protein [Paenibacillus senegalensis]|uniref:GGDEF domain-containing protein n=1 Tax=Paenibacillus senegalensis TaxID=1465766 RepID=UPI0002ECF53A|nr:GGDEF domain-containing protein [Paenibacillus senegalensis]
MIKPTVIQTAAWGAVIGVVTLAIALLLMRTGSLGLIAALLFAAFGGALVALFTSQWREMSITDDGTGLYNRRFLFKRLSIVFHQAHKEEQPLSLAVIDIDGFRDINNKYGHLAGDQTLLKVAQTLRASLREGDIVGRWGGEEFALIFPGTKLNDAVILCESIRSQIEEQRFKISEHDTVSVTISVGVAGLRQGDTTIEELIQRADKSMYEAKKLRNRVAFNPSPLQ